jgi:ABC-type phosphate transport system permease subunit
LKNLLNELVYDANFIKGHKLQPAWFKMVKVIILVAGLTGFALLFGWRRAAVFAAVFVLLMLIVHLIYRAGTRKFTRNWLDFIILEDKQKNRRPGIGAAYYTSILLNALIAFLLSGAFAG